jgi:hypothetical protein
MATWRSVVALCMLASCPGAAAAQSSHPVDPAIEPLLHGRLVVWIVHASAPKSNLEKVLSAKVYWSNSVQEQTAGSFGTPSSEVGQTAGSYGQPSSNVGTNASDTGVAAGDYGRPASDVGRTASNTGTSASDYGQTAGSFGQSLSTINDDGARTQQAGEDAYHHPPHDAYWTDWLQSLHNAFPDLQVDVVDVREDELKDSLDKARGTTSQPDIVAGDPLPPTWSRPGTGLLWQYGVTTLGSHVWVSQMEIPPGVTHSAQDLQAQISILRAAQRPDAARALMIWWLGGWGCAPCLAPIAILPGSANEVARQALTGLLQGEGLSNADPELARFNSQSARADALNASPIPDPLNVRVDVMQSASNDRLAVVSMRALLSGPQAFGAADALAVLRKDANGRWRVLQLTPNLARRQIEQGYSMLAGYARGDHAAHVAGVTLAAPPDGDNRGPQPELWWDNGGGAGLQIVEWQVKNGATSSISHLFFAPEHDMRLRTRVTADFATMPATYRWRVWSVGNGGALVLSPWRTMNIVR